MKMTSLEKEQIVLTKYFPPFKYEGVNEYKMLMSLNKKNKQSSVESYVSNREYNKKYYLVKNIDNYEI